MKLMPLLHRIVMEKLIKIWYNIKKELVINEVLNT